MLRLLLLGSGAAALAYEVLWARDWALVYGSTAVGTAVVLAAYFAGLALGAGLAARLGRRRRGLGLYGALEAGVAATALLYLGVRPLLPEAAVWLARTAPPVLLPAARALLAFAVLVVPTTLLGATLPAATATLAPGDASGAGRLYAWNTCGGALGALGCGVVAIRVLGVRGTFLAAAGLDAAVAAAALALARRTAAPAARRETSAQGAPPRLALVLAAAAGFAGLADEVLWTRGLAGVLSQSVYSIALVLAAVLVGIALGAVTGVRALGRAGAPEAWLGIAFVALALATLLSRLALRALPGASVLLVRGLGVIGPGAGLAVEAALAVLVVLVPALALGAIFPLVLGLAGAAAPGRAMGRVLAANTAGGVAGALGAAFVLLPRLGLGGGLLATAGIAALAALATRRTAGALAAAAVALAAVASPSLRLPWRAGDERILFYRDGAAATVMVTADARGDLRLRVNGQYSLGGSAGLLLEERQAHLPLLLHPRPTRLLALGVGTADTVGAALAHPGLRVDAVELVPEVLAAAAVFVRENRGALADPRARFVVDDARSFLLAAPGTYDVILSDLFLPWTAGTAYLYSADFYRVGLAHLQPGGLYCQWLPLHQLAVPDLEAIVASFTAAFPHVQLWVAYHRSATPLAALVGSAEPLGADAQPLRARAAGATLAPALAAAGLADPRDLDVLYVSDGARLRTATAGVALITDDRPRLEFTAPAAFFHQEGLARAALAWVAARLDPRPAPIGGASFALRAALLRAQLALLAGDGAGELGAYLDAFALGPEVPAVRAALAAIARERLAAGDRPLARRIANTLRGTPEGAALATAVGG